MKLENRIRLCAGLTPAEEQLADYLLKHQEFLAGATIQALAAQTYLSASSIHRFCRKIGLKGFKDLKKEALLSLGEPEEAPVDINFPFAPEDSVRTVADNLFRLYHATLSDTLSYLEEERFQKTVRLLVQADCIDLYTHAHNSFPAGMFADRMISIGKHVRCPAGFYNQRATALSAGRRHAAVIISFSGRAFFIPSILPVLQKKGCRIILIGRAGLEKDYPHIRHFLAISDREHLKNRISQFSSHLSLQYLLDLLYCCIFQADYEKNMDFLSQHISFLDDRQL